MIPKLELIYREVALSSDVQLGEILLRNARFQTRHALKLGGVGLAIWIVFPFLLWSLALQEGGISLLFVGPVTFSLFFGVVIGARFWNMRKLMRGLERNRKELEKVRVALATEVSCQISRQA